MLYVPIAGNEPEPSREAARGTATEAGPAVDASTRSAMDAAADASMAEAEAPLVDKKRAARCGGNLGG